MNISVTDAEGLPSGAYLSLRFGGTRRQAAYSPGQPFQFPSSNHKSLSVDVFEKVGSHVLRLEGMDDASFAANPERFEKIAIETQAGSLIKLGLKMDRADQAVRPTSSQTRKAKEDAVAREKEKAAMTAGGAIKPGAATSGSRRHLAALQAREYLDEHCVLQVVQSLLQNIVKDRPQDPWEYMTKHLPDGVKEAAKAPQAPPAALMSDAHLAAHVAEEEVVAQMPAKAPVSGQCLDEAVEISPEVSKPAAVDVEALRQKTKQSFEKGVADGSLMNILPAESVEVDAEAVPVSFSIEGLSFTALAADEQLKNSVISNVRGQLASAAGVEQSSVAVSLSAGSVCVSAVISSPDVAKVHTEIGVAAVSGLAATIVENVAAIPGIEKASVAGESISVKAVAVRQPEVVRIKRGKDGSILFPAQPVAQASEEQKSLDIRALRQKAGRALDKGSADGSLAQYLAPETTAAPSNHPNESQTMDLEAVRLKAKRTFENGAESGQLAQLLEDGHSAPPAVIDLAALRDKARCTFEKGAEDGRLQELLTVEQTAASEESLRAMAREALEKGAQDGSLGHAVLGEQPSESKEALRAKAKAALEAGVDSGKLPEIAQSLCAGEQPAASKEDVRAKAKAALEAGVDSGKLRQTLGVDEQPVASKEETRAKARAALEAGVDSGKLSQTLGVGEQPVASAEALRAKAKNALDEAAESGKLSQLLGQGDQPPVSKEDVRAKARASLEAGVESGKLSQTLGVGGQPVASKEDLGAKAEPVANESTDKRNEAQAVREKARACLEKGADGGELVEALRGDQVKPAPDVLDEPASVDVLAVRKKAQQSLAKGVEDGTLQQCLVHDVEPAAVVKPVANESVDALRQKAKASLESGIDDGRLLEVLGGVPGASAPGVSEPASVDVLAVRKKAQQSLAKGVEDGTLQECLVRQDEPPAAVNSIDVEALREKAKLTFEQGAEDGTLMALLTTDSSAGAVEHSGTDVEELRLKAKNTFMNWADDGSLADILGVSEGATVLIDVSELRLRAMRSLEKGAEDGTLAQCFADSASVGDINVVRQKAQESLAKSLDDGTLLQMCDPAQPDMVELLQKVKDTLEKAEEEGTLKSALEVQAPTAGVGTESAVVPLDQQAELRQQVKDVLEKSAVAGTLESFLVSNAQVEDVEVVRAKALENNDQAPEDTVAAQTAMPEGDDAEAMLLKAQEALSAACCDEAPAEKEQTSSAQDEEWLSKQDEVVKLQGEVNLIMDVNTSATQENSQLRDENRILREELARLMALETDDDCEASAPPAESGNERAQTYARNTAARKTLD